MHFVRQLPLPAQVTEDEVNVDEDETASLVDLEGCDEATLAQNSH